MYRLSILLVTAMLILSACGGGNKDEGSAAAQPQSEAAVANSGADAGAESADQAPVGDAAHGEEIFNMSCVACHGVGGIGVQSLGKDMTTSEFIAGLSDEELADFIKVGRDTSDPLNTTGVAMPSKGGNPALSEQDLLDVVAYIRTLHE